MNATRTQSGGSRGGTMPAAKAPKKQPPSRYGRHATEGVHARQNPCASITTGPTAARSAQRLAHEHTRTRRDFLTHSAMLGTALAAAPPSRSLKARRRSSAGLLCGLGGLSENQIAPAPSESDPEPPRRRHHRHRIESRQVEIKVRTQRRRDLHLRHDA